MVTIRPSGFRNPWAFVDTNPENASNCYVARRSREISATVRADFLEADFWSAIVESPSLHIQS